MGYLTPAALADSLPTNPTIVFQVNLETLNVQSVALPSRTTLDGNETVSEASNMKNTRTIYLPGLLNTNIEGIGPTGYLYHGQQFTVKGQMATYLKNTYVTNTVGQGGVRTFAASTSDVLQVISQS